MSVSSTNNVVILNADGSTHSFTFNFKIFAASDLKVIVRSSAGVETDQTLNSQYIIPDSSVDNASGGNILFKFNTGTSSDAHFSSSDFRPANGSKVILRQNIPLTQTLDLVNNDPFDAETLESSLDRIVLQVQSVKEAVDRSIKFSRSNLLDSSGSQISSTYVDIEEDTTARANKLLSFDSTGTPIATQEIGTLKGDWAASTAYQERDIVKDTSTSNHFIVNSAHTSSGSQPLTTNTNSSKYTAITNFSGATLSPGQLVVDNITIDGNTISTTNSNGDLTVSPNGTGDTIFNSEVKVYGNSLAPANHITLHEDDMDLEGSAPNISFFSLDTGSVPRYNTGEISFYGKNVSGANNRFAYIQSYQTSKTDGAVAGGIRILASSEANGIEEAAITTLGLDVTIGGKLKMSDVTSGKILIGDGTSYEEQAVSGDITINSSGVTAISSGVIVNADISSSAAIADSKLATITTADKVSGAAIQIDGATDGTSITVADADKILIDDGGTTKYINASQLNTYISAAASSVAADNITVGDSSVTLTTTSGNITIDAQANNSDIIFKGTDGSVDTTFLTISGADAGQATFNGKIVADAGIDVDDFNIHGTAISLSAGNLSIDAGDNILLNTKQSSGSGGATYLKMGGTTYGGLLNSSGELVIQSGSTPTTAVTFSGANATFAGTVASTGVLTANAGVVVDNITIDGTEIDLSSGDLTIDVAGNITLDADDGGHVRFKDGGAEYLSIYEDASNNPIIQASIADTNILFKGTDGSSVITALDLDIANSGFAFFNANAHFNESGVDTDFRIKSVNQTNMFYVDASTDRIGIGTDSPSATFHVSGDNPRARFTDTPNSVNFDIFMGDDNATVGMQTNHSLQFMTNDAERMTILSNGDVRFGSGSSHSPTIQGITNNGRTEGSPGYTFTDDLNTGMFQPSGNADTIAFSTAGSERVRIDSAGFFIVGRDNQNPQNAGFHVEQQGDTYITAEGSQGRVLYLTRLTSDGNIIDFVKDTSGVGSISTEGGYLKVIGGNGSVGSGLLYTNEVLSPRNAGGSASNGVLSLGESGAKFKDAHFSGNVDCAEITYNKVNNSAGNSGLNVSAQYSYDDNNTNTIGSHFHNNHTFIYINTNAGFTVVPVLSNGGAGIAWANYLWDPDNQTWTSANDMTFTQSGTSGNTFRIQISAGQGTGTIQRTSGSMAYQVYISRPAGGS